MGKFSRTWELVKQSFVVLRSDKQLMLFPVLSAISCLLVTSMIATGGTLLIMPAMASAAANGQPFHPNQSPLFLIGMFTMYVANYFVIVFFNVALSGRSEQPPDGRQLDLPRRHGAGLGAQRHDFAVGVCGRHGRHDSAHSRGAHGLDRPTRDAHHWHCLDAGLLLRCAGAGVRRPDSHRGHQALLEALPRYLGRKSDRRAQFSAWFPWC